MRSLKKKLEDFSSSYSNNHCSYSQNATKTQMVILLESGTDANSFSGNKVCGFTLCKGI